MPLLFYRVSLLREEDYAAVTITTLPKCNVTQKNGIISECSFELYDANLPPLFVSVIMMCGRGALAPVLVHKGTGPISP